MASPLLLLLLLLPSSLAQSFVELRTKSGPIRGVRRTVRNKPVDHFLGVPFAKPPIGPLRFKAPQPATPWTVVRNTTALSPTCWQYVSSALERDNGGTGIWVNNTVMSEDCLYLNVWAPSSASGSPPKPILLWIYGGGFMTGSANLEIYNGAFLAAEQNIIVASFQYRVGPFGFLHLPSSSSANVGLLDQRLAMQWVFDNARVFNGDPTRITLTGESAGAASVSMHLLSPGSHRFFQRGVLHSASFLSPWAFADPAVVRRRSRRLATGLGCLTASASAAASVSDAVVFRCLQGVSAAALNAKVASAIDGEAAQRLAAIKSRLGYTATPTPTRYLYDISFVPIALPPFFPVNGSEAMRRSTLKPAPLLVGTNTNEGTYFLLYALPLLANTFFGSPQRLPDWPARVEDLQLTPQRVTELIGRHTLPEKWMYGSLVALLGLQYDFPSPTASMSASERSNKTGAALEQVEGDFNFKCPLFNLALWYANRGDAVYMYKFDHRTKNLPMPAWMGVMHGYELDYLFGMPLDTSYTQRYYNYTPAEEDLSKDMMRRWANFVKTGNPNKGDSGTSEAITWPRFNETTERVLRLATDAAGNRLQVMAEGSKQMKVCRFWDLGVKRLAAKLENCPSNVVNPPVTRPPVSSSSTNCALPHLVSFVLLAALLGWTL